MTGTRPTRRLASGEVFLAVALLVPFYGPTATAQADPLPEFSWDRVPVAAHLGKLGGDFTDAELSFLSGRFSIITIEKTQGMKANDYVEQSMYKAARQLKERDPKVKVLFYLNSLIDYPQYSAARAFDAHPAWALDARNGRDHLARGGQKTIDVSKAAVRRWWVDVVKAAVSPEGRFDGVFADAVLNAANPENSRFLGDAKARQLEAGMRKLLAEAKKAMGPQKLLIYNGLRGQPKAFPDLGMSFLSLSDGAFLEHFDFPSPGLPHGDKQQLATDISLIQKAASRGKIVIVKGWPGFSWITPMPANPEAAARRALTFSLACFLVAAGKYSYFVYTWGYRSNMGSFEWYPEFDKPLGPPKGPAKRKGWRYTREFQHASISVDLESKSARIQWHPARPEDARREKEAAEERADLDVAGTARRRAPGRAPSKGAKPAAGGRAAGIGEGSRASEILTPAAGEGSAAGPGVAGGAARNADGRMRTEGLSGRGARGGKGTKASATAATRKAPSGQGVGQVATANGYRRTVLLRIVAEERERLAGVRTGLAASQSILKALGNLARQDKSLFPEAREMLADLERELVGRPGSALAAGESAGGLVARLGEARGNLETGLAKSGSVPACIPGDAAKERRELAVDGQDQIEKALVTAANVRAECLGIASVVQAELAPIEAAIRRTEPMRANALRAGGMRIKGDMEKVATLIPGELKSTVQRRDGNAAKSLEPGMTGLRAAAERGQDMILSLSSAMKVQSGGCPGAVGRRGLSCGIDESAGYSRDAVDDLRAAGAAPALSLARAGRDAASAYAALCGSGEALEIPAKRTEDLPVAE